MPPKTVISSGKTTCYNIVTDVENDNDMFTIYTSYDDDIINILDIGQGYSTRISRNDFHDETIAKEIVKFLNAGHDFFEVDDEEYWVRDNRNLNLRPWEQYTTPVKFKLVKITREYKETLTYEDIKV